MAWRAIYAEPRREFIACGELRKRGVRAFCPHEMIKDRRPVRGRRNVFQIVEEARPYFRGYLFAETEALVIVEGSRLVPIDTLRGVVCVVGNGLGQPLEVPRRDIEMLLDVANDDGMISAIDATRLSYRFRGRPGDFFEFINCGFSGSRGKIVSLDRLDSKGEVDAIVYAFGAEREISVPYQSVALQR
jgi:hypothetical protein